MSKAVPQGWKIRTIGDLVKLEYGKSPKEVLTKDGTYPVIGTGGITGFASSYLYDGCTTVIGRKGTINKPSYVEGRFWPIDTTYFGTSYKDAEPKWFYYVLNSFDLSKYNEASGVPSLSRDTLNTIPLVTPPLPEQQKIAAILSSVDDVIEKTRAQIDKLKDLKTGMMQELLTKGIGHTEFKDSPVGRIPAKWGIGTLDSFGLTVVDGDRGKEYPKEREFYPFGYCLFLSAKNVTKHGFAFSDMSFIKKDKDKLLRKGKLIRGDIVITTRGTIGNIAYYGNEVPFDNVRINSGMAIIRNHTEKLDTQFLHLLMNSPMIREQIDLLAFGSAQPQLTIAIIKALNIPKPSLDEQRAIAAALTSVDTKHQIATQKLGVLEATKKALMQDLLTGRVRVKLDSNKPETVATQAAEAIEEQQYDHA